VGDKAMHGREPERRIIRGLLRRAQQGNGAVVLVDGEPGIGKSLLLREGVGEAAEQGFSLVVGAGDQLGRALPFFPLHAALGEQFARLTASDPDRDLSDTPGWWIGQMHAHLERRASATPVLVCLDDLQWASPAALAALRTLPLELRRHPVAWLLARASTPPRDTEYLFGLLEKEGAARITLAPLDDDTTATLLTGAFSAPPDQSLLALAYGAAGNPALLTELIRGLHDDKGVRVTGDRAVLVTAELPRRVQRVARRRLDGLSKQARHLLMMAAALGPSFRLEDAAEMLGETPTGLLPTVEEAMDAGIMTASGNTFSFRHPLLGQAVGDMIPGPARKALHRQYGQILLRRGEPAALAAGHLLQATRPGDPALADLDAAAAQILPSAPQAAADLALRALELTPPNYSAALSRAVAATRALAAAGRLDQAARLAHDTLAKPLPPIAEAGLRCALSSVLRARGQASDAAGQAEMVLSRPELPHDLREEALTAYLLALAEWRDGLAGPRAEIILADASQHDSHAVVAALIARAVAAWDNGQIGEALRLLRDAARRGTGISPDARHPQPLLSLAAALVDLRQLEEADSILHAADHPALHGIPAQAGLFILHARIHLANGRLPEADAACRAALASAGPQGADGYTTTAYCVLAVIALRRGDVAAAAQHVASLHASMPHFPGLLARTETTLAETQVIEGRDGPDAAISHIRQTGPDLAEYQGLLAGDPATAAWLVRTSLATGDQSLANQVADTAAALAEANPGFPALAASAAHSQGIASRDKGLLGGASAHHPDPWARASATEDLAVLLTSTAKDHAIRHLEMALDGYRQIGADRDQARIRRRLRELGVRHRHWTTPATRPITGWDSLTDTEQAVSRLVAEGLNNNQIAARMYISTHTVAHHLRQAFRKLRIASRVELARIVIEDATRPREHCR
jgi:DNA-binding CsgD family transcriptional regulator/tetratricopeptide (TPR) repeat protein